MRLFHERSAAGLVVPPKPKREIDGAEYLGLLNPQLRDIVVGITELTRRQNRAIAGIRTGLVVIGDKYQQPGESFVGDFVNLHLLLGEGSHTDRRDANYAIRAAVLAHLEINANTIQIRINNQTEIRPIEILPPDSIPLQVCVSGPYNAYLEEVLFDRRRANDPIAVLAYGRYAPHTDPLAK